MELMECSFVSTNFEYYGGIQNLEYEALYQGIISATLLMRGSRQYNSPFTKEGSSSPQASAPLEHQGPSPSMPPGPQTPSLGLSPSCARPPAPPAGPRYPFESGLLEAGDKALECITSRSFPRTAGQRVLLTITGPGILINFKQCSGPKGDDVL